MVSGGSCEGGLCARSPAARSVKQTLALSIGGWHFPRKGGWHLFGPRRRHRPFFRAGNTAGFQKVAGTFAGRCQPPFWLVLPAEPDAEASLALAVGARDHGEPVEIADGAVRIELQVRDVAARVVEVGGVQEIEHLESNLEVTVVRQHDLSE